MRGAVVEALAVGAVGGCVAGVLDVIGVPWLAALAFVAVVAYLAGWVRG